MRRTGRRKLIRAVTALAAMILTMSCLALAEEENTGTVVCISDWPEERLTAVLPEDGTAVEGGNGLDWTDDAGEDSQDDLSGSDTVWPGTVFGTDDRITVQDTGEYPYVAIAYMKIHHACGCDSTGTGFMADKNKLITAAHCIVCTKHGKWANRITFYFGYRNDRRYTYKYSGKWYAFVGNTFPDGYTTENDWAVVKLYKNVGNQVGWFGFKYNMPDSTISGKLLRVAGYRNGKLKKDSGFATVGSGNLIYYEMDSEPGNSGGPVYYLDHGDPYAAAINIAESKSSNYGYRITALVYRYFLELDNY